MTSQEFFIEKTKFSAEFNSTDNFIVKSVLGDYCVTLSDEKNPLARISALLSQDEHILIIDKQLLELYDKEQKLTGSNVYAVKATEEEKSLDGSSRFIDYLIEKKASKSTTILVVGGGIVQEIGAFAASCYKRGVKWVFFPTTLLAMCDSCIGAKSSLNYKGVKNQLGLFSAPSEVVINVNFLNSLPLTDLKSGLGEILKLCIIAGGEALSKYKDNINQCLEKSPDALETMILISLQIKKSVIEIDEFDLNERKALNYGHTVGHIVESLTDFQLPHGLAVVVGIIFANHISNSLDMLNASDLKSLDQLCFNLLDKKCLEQVISLDIEAIIELLASDKKTRGNILQFIVLDHPSKTVLYPVDLRKNNLMNVMKNLFEYITSIV